MRYMLRMWDLEDITGITGHQKVAGSIPVWGLEPDKRLSTVKCSLQIYLSYYEIIVNRFQKWTMKSLLHVGSQCFCLMVQNVRHEICNDDAIYQNDLNFRHWKK